jgi:hypothetical protein
MHRKVLWTNARRGKQPAPPPPPVLAVISVRIFRRVLHNLRLSFSQIAFYAGFFPLLSSSSSYFFSNSFIAVCRFHIDKKIFLRKSYILYTYVCVLVVLLNWKKKPLWSWLRKWQL